jgi:hypothetical protein
LFVTKVPFKQSFLFRITFLPIVFFTEKNERREEKRREEIGINSDSFIV